jgi:hypothetical protein
MSPVTVRRADEVEYASCFDDLLFGQASGLSDLTGGMPLSCAVDGKQNGI